MAAAAFGAQLFLGYRIYRLSENFPWRKPLYWFIVLFAVVNFALGIACDAAVWMLDSIDRVWDIRSIATAWKVTEMLNDYFITISLSYLLIRSRKTFHPTQSISSRIVCGCIQTGAFTGLFAMLSLILYLSSTTSHAYVLPAFVLGRIYSATVMDTLLSRHDPAKTARQSVSDFLPQ
ncbi:hypothetical protein H0H92_013343 [Tricholoma furcatifolium]|nr:hypothetical protein H0H92_013343 [Tricholoma furcatifolium]